MTKIRAGGVGRRDEVGCPQHGCTAARPLLSESGTAKPVVKTIRLRLKRHFPQIKYIEAFNEPDHDLAEV